MERGTIFARWFALGETGGRVQAGTPRGVVGELVPPLLVADDATTGTSYPREFVPHSTSRPSVLCTSLLSESGRHLRRSGTEPYTSG